MHPPETILSLMSDAIQTAGDTLLHRFDPGARPGSLAELLDAILANEQAVRAPLESRLLEAVPGSHFLDDHDEHEDLTGADHEYGWVVDTVEGNVNHIHGREGWAVTACLLRARQPFLAAVYIPLTKTLFTAALGQGAKRHDQRLRVSGKTELRAAVVATAQARPFEDAATHAVTSRLIRNCLNGALLVRASVPSTFELVDLAAGRLDAFWQHAGVSSGLAAGALLVREAGGIVTDLGGNQWHPESTSFVASSQGLHAQVLGCLRGDA